MVKKIVEYRCSVCDSGYKSEKSADCCEVRCADKAKSRKLRESAINDAREYPRLNARSIPEFLSLIKESVKITHPKIKNFDIFSRGAIYFSSNINYLGSPGYFVEFTITDTDIFTDIPQYFGLVVSSGNGIGNNKIAYQGYVLLDDLPLIKQIAEENEVKRIEFAATVVDMNQRYANKYDVDEFVVSSQHEIDVAYNKYVSLRRELKDYCRDTYVIPALEEFETLPKREQISVGEVIKSNINPPQPFTV